MMKEEESKAQYYIPLSTKISNICVNQCVVLSVLIGFLLLTSKAGLLIKYLDIMY